MGKSEVKPDPVAPDQQAPDYTKQQFLGSAKYAAHKDVLNALLVDGKTYTSDNVDQLIKEFLEQEVK